MMDAETHNLLGIVTVNSAGFWTIRLFSVKIANTHCIRDTHSYQPLHVPQDIVNSLILYPDDIALRHEEFIPTLCANCLAYHRGLSVTVDCLLPT